MHDEEVSPSGQDEQIRRIPRPQPLPVHQQILLQQPQQ
ncbi:hypothetical protein GQ55_8G182100 [Panicum hallii var. hallii]|uniref:Uncharacterized protein n=1 Tax=Panicum hallii var. hallii TaxID=1504633 RepID=A0A2T7CNQ6_9POAL|nr:hypothetical protein GQ55_8G182100 [Panicum hallii var. hallii]